ncbi:bifunctional adenosylcobinamide kinase/adenosylcobinamide-phosphate guanylyltransferase [Desulfonatronum thioautotrophicum]|uniref:bifunctional adenosylcobinamide kinase/adenosylcobinamide-phosphate guanylyltransferase n=1 Tax=Desulfonatronum thioautotrophicum TaxID=617001 RepID=UPI0005EAD71A|nr:bifunctional adenosylcobinamide kinase/adenosylcobinamide-phosphate guanylyltransferase [Desulfonatronum thioautotrophicum]
MITLILGGEKSGKSAWALQRLLQADGPRLFVGTAVARDMEMRRRIRDHRRLRPPDLPVRETGLELPKVLHQERTGHAAILVDSLDFWLFAAIQADQEVRLRAELLEVLGQKSETHLIFVSSEIGLGPIQVTPLGRQFVRALGSMNQQMASLADEVVLIVAGLPLRLKGVS